MKSWIGSAAVYAAIALLTLFLFTPFCGLLHRCGCRPIGLGAESSCNFNNVGGPHCPWCEHPAIAGVVAAAILAAEAAAFALARRRWSRTRAALVALASFPVVGVVAGALAWLPTDYPHFLVLDARAKLGLPAGPIGTMAAHTEAKADCCAPTRR
jgi:hypothetical protein